MVDVYLPGEDSFLILKEIKDYALGNVLDMGTGSGVLALEATKTAQHVIAADINPKALDYAKYQAKRGKIKNIKFVASDLFSNITGKFDLIIFNPPYLPLDTREPIESRVATTGGRKGYELIERFFSSVSDYLEDNGKILVVFSSLTGEMKTQSIMEEFGFNYQKLAEMKIPWEELFVYVAEKSDIFIALERDNISDIKKFAKGQRGVIYTGYLDNVKVAAKMKREGSAAIGRIENEARWLKLLNRRGVGPKLLYIKEKYFVYEFVEGEFISDFVENSTKNEMQKVLVDVFNQCFIMDKMNASKEEMHHPLKHVIVGKKITLIDFERMHFTEKPQNVTQFCQYVSGQKVLGLLKKKGFKFTKAKINSLAQKYKKNINQENFDKIINVFL